MATPLEECVVRARFHSLSSVGRGLPPLEKVARRFTAVALASSQGDVSAVEAEFLGLLKEVSAVAYVVSQLEQRAGVQSRESEEAGRRKEALAGKAEETDAGIAELAGELARAQKRRKRLEAYEEVRLQVATEPPRAKTARELAKLEEEVDAARKAGDDVRALRAQRRAQASALLAQIDAAGD